jgi:hypothetical protein
MPRLASTFHLRSGTAKEAKLKSRRKRHARVKEKIRTRGEIYICTNNKTCLNTCRELSNLKWPSENIESTVIERVRQGARGRRDGGQMKGKEHRGERLHETVSTRRVEEGHIVGIIPNIRVVRRRDETRAGVDSRARGFMNEGGTLVAF